MNGNHHVHEHNPMFTQAIHEHEQLHRRVLHIHALLDKHSEQDVTDVEVQEVVRVVQDLHGRMHKHFEQEEEGGYLEEAITRVPSLATQAALLQKQHAELSRMADRMLADARTTGQPAEIWRRLKTDYGRFAKKLLGHEAAENNLLERAFNEDLGADV